MANKSNDLLLMETIKNGTEDEKREAKLALFNQYKLQIYKQEHTLKRKIHDTNMHIEVENYMSEAWVAYEKAVNSIKIEKITNPKTWTFWACFNGYLMSHNRDYISHRLKEQANEISLSNFVDDDDNDYSDVILKDTESAESTFIKNEEKNAFWSAVENTKKRLTSQQNKVFELKSTGARRKEVCEKLGINSDEYYAAMDKIKSTLKSNLDIKASAIGGISYLY